MSVNNMFSFGRIKWLEYKMQYKEMQKEHMKKIKQDLRTDPEVVERSEILSKSDLSFQPGVIVRIDSTNEDGLQKKSVKVWYIFFVDIYSKYFLSFIMINGIYHRLITFLI